MKEHTQKLLDKSLDVLEAAEALLKIGKIDVAAGRAYYSMMHTAEALLFETQDLSFNKHGDIHGHMVDTFQRRNFSTLNFIAGCWMPLTRESLEIMM